VPVGWRRSRAYWASIGAAACIRVDRRPVGIDRLLRCCLVGAATGAVLFAAPLPAEAAFAGLAVAGVGLAPVFPCLRAKRRSGWVSAVVSRSWVFGRLCYDRAAAVRGYSA